MPADTATVLACELIFDDAVTPSEAIDDSVAPSTEAQVPVLDAVLTATPVQEALTPIAPTEAWPVVSLIYSGEQEIGRKQGPTDPRSIVAFARPASARAGRAQGGRPRCALSSSVLRRTA